MLSWISAENTILVVLCSALLIKMLKRFNDLKILYVGLFIYTIGFTILGTSNSLWILLIAGLFQTVGEMMYVPVRQSIMADMVPNEARGSYMAINGMVFKWQNERGIRCYARFIYRILGHECSVLYRWYEQYFIIYEGDREREV